MDRNTGSLVSLLNRRAARVEEWLNIHRELMDAESAFTDLAVQAAAGNISLKTLDEKREELMALRTRCTLIYEDAFKKQMRG